MRRGSARHATRLPPARRRGNAPRGRCWLGEGDAAGERCRPPPAATQALGTASPPQSGGGLLRPRTAVVVIVVVIAILVFVGARARFKPAVVAEGVAAAAVRTARPRPP
mmetsp:Transcript_1581/g.3567  ORF Transcript_1581/g.3567 Transcript_1581/m.3567 type:complete len:109 (+) Transcript_1581:694-1020(+)